MSETFVPKPEIHGYLAVRKAARNAQEYSSDLLGDADVRTYRQLPLEADPPRHTDLRVGVMPLFSEENLEPRMPEFRALARDLITSVQARGGVEVVSEFALPYVMGALAIVYSRPQDRDEWISWGPDVWLADAWMHGDVITEETKQAQRDRNYSVQTQRSGAVLEEYLNRVFDEARPDPKPYAETGDVWSFLTQMRPGGAELTRQEMLGFGNVLLAGGRDTVIKLITGFIWHLIGNEQDRVFLRDNPDSRRFAIHEMARFLSPLPKMERLRPGAADDSDANRVVLSFASANFDRSIFDDPEHIDFHREPTPNVAFGFGRHSCLGLQVTEHETLALLDVLLSDWPDWHFDGDPQIVWMTEDNAESSFTIIGEFESVRITAP